MVGRAVTICEDLLVAGADLLAINNQGDTPLHVSVGRANTAAIPSVLLRWASRAGGVGRDKL